jgi:hypothetical protein
MKIKKVRMNTSHELSFKTNTLILKDVLSKVPRPLAVRPANVALAAPLRAPLTAATSQRRRAQFAEEPR